MLDTYLLKWSSCICMVSHLRNRDEKIIRLFDSKCEIYLTGISLVGCCSTSGLIWTNLKTFRLFEHDKLNQSKMTRVILFFFSVRFQVGISFDSNYWFNYWIWSKPDLISLVPIPSRIIWTTLVTPCQIILAWLLQSKDEDPSRWVYLKE